MCMKVKPNFEVDLFIFKNRMDNVYDGKSVMFIILLGWNHVGHIHEHIASICKIYSQYMARHNIAWLCTAYERKWQEKRKTKDVMVTFTKFTRYAIVGLERTYIARIMLQIEVYMV